MNNTLAGQLEQFYDTILAQRGVVITYRQREIVIENVPAIPKVLRLSNEKNAHSRPKFGSREYIVKYASLVWKGEQVKPKPGDSIIDGDTVYDVTESETKQCCTPADTLGMYARIYVTKMKKKE